MEQVIFLQVQQRNPENLIGNEYKFLDFSTVCPRSCGPLYIVLGASEVSANLYCNSRKSVLGRLRDYLQLLMGRTITYHIKWSLLLGHILNTSETKVGPETIQ